MFDRSPASPGSNSRRALRNFVNSLHISSHHQQPPSNHQPPTSVSTPTTEAPQDVLNTPQQLQQRQRNLRRDAIHANDSPTRRRIPANLQTPSPASALESRSAQAEQQRTKRRHANRMSRDMESRPQRQDENVVPAGSSY